MNLYVVKNSQLRVREKFKGGIQNDLKNLIFMGIIFDLGNGKGVQFLFGGAQKGTILIWGYASINR